MWGIRTVEGGLRARVGRRASVASRSGRARVYVRQSCYVTHRELRALHRKRTRGTVAEQAASFASDTELCSSSQRCVFTRSNGRRARRRRDCTPCQTGSRHLTQEPSSTGSPKWRYSGAELCGESANAAIQASSFTNSLQAVAVAACQPGWQDMSCGGYASRKQCVELSSRGRGVSPRAESRESRLEAERESSGWYTFGIDSLSCSWTESSSSPRSAGWHRYDCVGASVAVDGVQHTSDSGT